MVIDANKRYTLQESAEYCRVSEQTMRRWIKRGFLPAERSGLRKIVISGSALLSASVAIVAATV